MTGVHGRPECAEGVRKLRDVCISAHWSLPIGGRFAKSSKMSRDSATVSVEPPLRGPPALSGMRFASVIPSSDEAGMPLRLTRSVRHN